MPNAAKHPRLLFGPQTVKLPHGRRSARNLKFRHPVFLSQCHVEERSDETSAVASRGTSALHTIRPRSQISAKAHPPTGCHAEAQPKDLRLFFALQTWQTSELATNRLLRHSRPISPLLTRRTVIPTERSDEGSAVAFGVEGGDTYESPTIRPRRRLIAPFAL